MNRDRIAFQRAEAGLSTLLKTNPICHLRSPGAVGAASFDRAALCPW
jgi:hypothetical protein